MMSEVSAVAASAYVMPSILGKRRRRRPRRWWAKKFYQEGTTCADVMADLKLDDEAGFRNFVRFTLLYECNCIFATFYYTFAQSAKLSCDDSDFFGTRFPLLLPPREGETGS